MDEKRHHYWAELNRYLTFAVHELLYIPTCCVQCVKASKEKRKEFSQTSHMLVKVDCQHFDAQSEAGEPGATIVHSKQVHIHKTQHEDIIARAHSGDTLKYAHCSNTSFHNWLINDFDRMDPYKALPHPSGFEQNLTGLKDEHLQRVEQYWIDHQLHNPSCSDQRKSLVLATAADWEAARLIAEEAGHRMAENV